VSVLLKLVHAPRGMRMRSRSSTVAKKKRKRQAKHDSTSARNSNYHMETARAASASVPKRMPWTRPPRPWLHATSDRELMGSNCFNSNQKKRTQQHN
jgi:hypothetical protein